VVDFGNEASFPSWRALPGRPAADLAVAAAEAGGARMEALSGDAVAYVGETGCHFILDRAGHRNEHLDQIETTLA